MRSYLNFKKIRVLFFLICIPVGWATSGYALNQWNGKVLANINLRQSPSLGGKIITGLEKGKNVSIKDKHGDWYQILFEGKTFGIKGWVFGKYVEKLDRIEEKVPYSLEIEKKQSELQKKPPENKVLSKNVSFTKKEKSHQPTERNILKPVSIKGLVNAPLDEKEKKQKPTEALKKEAPSLASSQPILKADIIPLTASVKKSFFKPEGLSFFNRFLLIISPIILLFAAFLFLFRASQLAKLNRDVSMQLDLIKNKINQNSRKVKEKRRNPRSTRLIEVDFAVQDRAYGGFIRDLSASGAFIETIESFSVGQELMMTFPSPKENSHIKIAAKIVRTNHEGIGVEFTNKV